MVTIGDTRVSLLSNGYVFDPQQGSQIMQVFQGFEEPLAAFAEQCKAAGARVTLRQHEGPWFHCEVVWGAASSAQDDDPVDTWERLTEWREVDLRSNPKLLAAAAVVTPEDPYGTLNAWFKRIKKDIADGLGRPNDIIPAVTELHTLLSMGQESYPVHSVVLRRRRTIPLARVAQSKPSAIPVAYTTAKLISTFKIPDAIADKLPDEGENTPRYHVWGWLEREDSSTLIPSQARAEENKTWVFGALASLIYTFA